MILGIDASNIYSGGGVAHLVEVLRAADPTYYGFEKVIVWGGEKILNKLENRNWLKKVMSLFWINPFFGGFIGRNLYLEKKQRTVIYYLYPVDII